MRRFIKLKNFLYTDLVSELKPNDCFYDIGAHLGLYSCLAAECIDEGEIYAFEPYSQNSELLNENVKINNADVKCFEIIISNSQGEKNLERPFLFGPTSWVSVDDSKSFRSQKQKSSTLDSIVAKQDLEPPDIIKIDVEGHENEVLSGMKKTLKQCRVLYIEIHEGNEVIDEKLEEQGFEVEWREERTSTNYFLKAIDNS